MNKRAGTSPRLSPGRPFRGLFLLALAILAGGVLVEVGRSLAAPEGSSGAGQGGSITVVTGQVGRDSYGAYLIDTRNKTICVYQLDQSSKKLELLATRTFAFDVQLDEYNTEPSPREIRQLVEQHRRLTDEPARPNGPVEPTEQSQEQEPAEPAETTSPSDQPLPIEISE
jgi:hypothetical protein